MVVLSDNFNDLTDDNYLYQRTSWTTDKSAPHAMRSDRHADTDDGTQVLDGSGDFGSSASAERATYNTQLGSDDHEVSLDVFPDLDGSDTNPNWEGVIARASNAAATDCYWAVAETSDSFDGYSLWRRVAGASTRIGEWAFAHNTTGVYRLALKCDGSTISVTVDGVERISVTDTNVTTGRYAGIIFLRATASTNGQPWVDNWAAEDLAAAAFDGSFMRLGTSKYRVRMGGGAKASIRLGNGNRFEV